MLELDRGRIVTMVGLETSETAEFFQSEGSIISTKSAGGAAFEKRVFPKPQAIPGMFRSVDKYTVDVHAAIDELLAVENPMLKIDTALSEIGKLSAGKVVDALVFRPMSECAGAMYRVSETYADRSMDKTNRDGSPMVWNSGVRNAAGNSGLGLYYSVPGIPVSNPLDGVFKLRLIGEFADRLFTADSMFLPLLSDLITDMYGRVVYILQHKTVDELLASPELQLLIGLNGIISGARRLPLAKDLIWAGPVGDFFGAKPIGDPGLLVVNGGGPAAGTKRQEEIFGPEMSTYLQENLIRLNDLLSYSSKKSENAIDDNVRFSTSTMIEKLKDDLWIAGTPTLWLSDLATSIRIFQQGRKSVGKMRIRMGSRTRDYQMMVNHLDALCKVLESMPEIQTMKWTYDTDRYHMKTAFGGWSMTPVKYRVYNAIINPMAELLSMMDPNSGVASQLLTGTTLMSYEPLAVTKRSSSSRWLFDVPPDHMALEIPVIYWSDIDTDDQWIDLKEWCRSQTPRVVRPSVLENPLGQWDLSGIFPVNPAVLEGTVMATAVRTDRQIIVDKEHTLSKVDGNVCLPESTLASRIVTNFSLYQLPDRTVIAEKDPPSINDVPSGWDY